MLEPNFEEADGLGKSIIWKLAILKLFYLYYS